MKKFMLILAVCLLSCGRPDGSLNAQPTPRHVYLYEGFDSFSTSDTRFDTANWDLVSDTSYRFLFYSSLPTAGGLSPEAGWGYMPSAGMSRRLSGVCRFASKPYAMQAASRNYASAKFYYYANVASTPGTRSFGLAARKAGGDWVALGTIDSIKTKEGPLVLTAELPAEFQEAADVQMAVYLQTTVDRSNYALYFDDITFFAYPDHYRAVAFTWGSKPYTDGILDVDLRIENTGNAMHSCKIAYTFDDGAPQTLSLVFEGALMPGQVHTLPGFEPAGWENAAPGHHTVTFWLSEADGVAIPESAVVKQRKTLSLTNVGDFTTYAYRPLVEEFSSSSCSSCKPRNTALKPVFEALGDRVAVVKYQMYWPGKGDPYYTEDGGLRKIFYDLYNVPEIYLNGRHDLAGGGAFGMQTRFAEKIDAPAYFDITFDTLALDADTNIYIVCNVQSSVPMDGLRLHTVVLEGQTEGNVGSNGETEFHHVMLKMLPDGKGLALDIKPDTLYTFRYGYDMRRTFMEESDDLKVVCFLQASDDSVMQAAIGEVSMRIDAMPIPPLSDEKSVFEILPVYPNPASDEVYLHGLNAAAVEVFNMAGRRVFRQSGIEGDYVLDVRGYHPGFYLVIIRDRRGIARAKLSVVR